MATGPNTPRHEKEALPSVDGPSGARSIIHELDARAEGARVAEEEEAASVEGDEVRRRIESLELLFI